MASHNKDTKIRIRIIMKFRDFLLRGDLIFLAIAVYMGGLIASFLSEFVDGFGLPIVLEMFGGSNELELDDIAVNIGSRTYRVGKLLMSAFKLMLGIALTYIVIRMIVGREK